MKVETDYELSPAATEAVCIPCNLVEFSDDYNRDTMDITTTPCIEDASMTSPQERATTTIPDFDNSNQNTDQSMIVIRISDQEKHLLKLLNDVTLQYNKQKLKDGDVSLPLIVRIAGGWVRDKVLGHPYDQNTNDIDIAINIISGVQFAELVQTYLLSQQAAEPTLNDKNETSSGETPTRPNIHKMGVIAANPDQSKHLETACMKLYDIDIDFTNLRCHEVYSNPDNRIPDTTIQFGTPQSDAYRRDFTVNALYYNITSKMVEDYTTRGLLDLHNRYLQTPLDPQVTFADDPLRILRAIRFAIRFQLSMDDQIVAAAQNLSIQQALQNKVSRERVGKELEGMLSGKYADPISALQTIHRLHLSSSIFSLPITGIHCTSISGTFYGSTYLLSTDSIESHSDILDRWDESIRLVAVLKSALQIQNDVKSKHVMDVSRLDRRVLPLVVYLFPFGQLNYIDIPKNIAATAREFNVVTFIMKDSLKFKNADVQAMSIILRNVNSMIDLFLIYANDTFVTERGRESIDDDLRLKIGTILLDAKELWVTILLLATVALIHRNNEQKVQLVDPGNSEGPSNDTNLSHSLSSTYQLWLQRCNTIYHEILYKYELDNCWNTIRPLMNGQELIREMNLPKGPAVGFYMEEQMKYLIRSPTSSKQQCVQYLQELDSSTFLTSLELKALHKKKKTKT